MAPPVTRRTFVIGAGAVGSALVAGCTGSPGAGQSSTEGGTTTGESMTTEGGTTGPGGTTAESTAAMTETGSEGAMTVEPTDPATAPHVAVDRFSEAAGTLQVRTADNGLPGPNEPVDFDAAPFITRGLGPDGSVVEYYNFDVQSTTPAPIFVLVREGEDAPVDGQLNVVDDVPGDDDYNDFWHVHLVTVPADYVANTLTSAAAIQSAGHDVTETDMLVNCPVVPDGSTATKRLGDEPPDLVEGWYRDQVVSYFQFTEAPLAPNDGRVPVSPIYVSFNRNPDQPGGGPPSGFVAEADGVQTHNVVSTLPGDAGYSPLWLVNVYDNADFDVVSDLPSAMAADQLAAGVATVNCPIVVAP